MPRIPQIVSNETPNSAHLSVGAAALPGQALARAGDQIAGVGDEMLAKQVQLAVFNDATRATTDASLEIDAAIRKEQLNPDFRSYPARVDAAVNKISGQAIKGVRAPEVQARLNAELSNRREVELIKARDFSRTREIDYGKSNFLGALDASRNRLAGLAGFERVQELDHIKRISSDALSLGLFSESQMYQLTSGFADGVQTDQAHIDGLIDPLATAQQLIKGVGYEGLTPTKRLELASQMMTAYHANITLADKALERTRNLAVSQDVSLARDGNLTLSDLEAHRKKYEYTATEYDVVRNFIEKGPQFPSDSTKLLDYTVDVNSTSATRALQGQIDADYHSKNLNRDDYWQLTTRLTENLNHLELTGKGGTPKERQTQAEQLLRANFGVTSPLDSITGEAKSAYATALKELTDRSVAYGGKEDPLSIVPQIAAKFAPLALMANRTQIERLRANLPFHTIPELGTRAQAKARGMSDADYNSLFNRIQELDKKLQSFESQQQRSR